MDQTTKSAKKGSHLVLNCFLEKPDEEQNEQSTQTDRETLIAACMRQWQKTK